MKIGILTDTGCNLNTELITRYEIETIPLLIQLDGEEYISGVEIKKSELINKLKSTTNLFAVNVPSVGAFRAKYKEMAAEYDQIISLHTASEFSSAVDNAQAAAEDISNAEVAVIDTGTTSIGLGLLVRLAAQLRKQKLEFTELVDKIKKAARNVIVYLVVDEIICLEKSDLACNFKKTALKLLKIKPIVRLKTSTQQLKIKDYIWGAKKAEKKLQELVVNKLADRGQSWVGLTYGVDKEKLARIQEGLSAVSREQDLKYCLLESQLGMPLLGKVGPSVYGAAVLTGDLLT